MNFNYYLYSNKLLEKSLVIHEENYGKDHIETARVLVSLGKNNLLQGKLEKAEYFLNIALKTFQQKQHPDVYIVLESLADLYLVQLQTKTNNKNNVNVLKDKATSYLIQALKIAEIQFLEESEHRMRINKKLRAIREG